MTASANTTYKEEPITIVYEPKARSDFIIREIHYHNQKITKTPDKLTEDEYAFMDAVVLEKRKIKESFNQPNKFNAMTEPTTTYASKKEYPPMELYDMIKFGEKINEKTGNPGVDTKFHYVLELVFKGGRDFKDTLTWLQNSNLGKGNTMFSEQVMDFNKKWKKVRKDDEFRKGLVSVIVDMVNGYYDTMPQEKADF